MEILNHREVGSLYYSLEYGFFLHFAGIILVIVGMIFLGLLMADKLKKPILFIATLPVGIVMFGTFNPNTVPYDEYDAVVHDWNEVYDGDYEIISQEGKIVTLRKYRDVNKIGGNEK